MLSAIQLYKLCWQTWIDWQKLLAFTTLVKQRVVLQVAIDGASNKVYIGRGCCTSINLMSSESILLWRMYCSIGLQNARQVGGNDDSVLLSQHCNMWVISFCPHLSKGSPRPAVGTIDWAIKVCAWWTFLLLRMRKYTKCLTRHITCEKACTVVRSVPKMALTVLMICSIAWEKYKGG